MVVHKLTAQFILSLAFCSAGSLPDAPRKAPDFQIHMADGKNLSLSEFRGKKVCVVAFISTTCPHCQAYVQMLSGIQRDYAERGVQILGVAFDDGAEKALPGFLQQFRPAFPLGWDKHADVMGFLQISILSPGFVPKVAFIDRGGTIRKQFQHQDRVDEFFNDPDKSTRATLDEILKAPATTHKSTPSAQKKTASTTQK